MWKTDFKKFYLGHSGIRCLKYYILPISVDILIVNIRMIRVNVKYLSRLHEVQDFLRDMVPFVQFQKREKHPWTSVTFSIKSNTHPWVFSTFFKLYQWYQGITLNLRLS